MAPLRYTAKLDPFLSLDCTRVKGGAGTIQGKEGVKFYHLATLLAAPPYNDLPSSSFLGHIALLIYVSFERTSAREIPLCPADD